MKFKKEFLLDLIYGEEAGFVVEDTIVSTGRWAIDHRMIFEVDDKFYELLYQRAATEMQDMQPLEDYRAGGMIDCDEVLPTPKTITVYVKPYKKVKVPGEGVAPRVSNHKGHRDGYMNGRG
jgi:hypothetical protein